MKNTISSRLILLGLWGTLSGFLLPTPLDSAMQIEGSTRKTSINSARKASESGTTERAQLGPAGLAPGRDAATVDRAIADAEWTMSITPEATILILHKGSPVVQTRHLAWGKRQPALVWAGGQFRAERVRPGEAILTGGIPALDLKATGTIRPVAPNVIRVEYQFTAAKAHEGIKGAVLDWKFELNSPSFDKKAADPIILENNTGWTWPVGPNQAIVVRFEQPQDLEHYEVNQKNNIRTYYYAERIEPGTRRVSYTVQLPEGGRIALRRRSSMVQRTRPAGSRMR